MKILKNFLVIVFGAVCVVFSFLGYYFPEKIAIKNAESVSEASLNYAASSLKERIFSAKNKMQILAKNSYLSRMKSVNHVLNMIKQFELYLNSIFFSSDIDMLIIDFNEYVIDCKDRFYALKDVPEAFERLFYYLISFKWATEEDEEDGDDSKINSDSENYVYVKGSNFLHIYNNFVKNFFYHFFNGISAAAKIGGSMGWFKNVVPEDYNLCASIISSLLDSGEIKKIVLRNSDLDDVLSVGYESFLHIYNDDLIKTINGSAYGNGGLIYSESGAPYWQITVPIRDENRMSNFYMTGFVSVGDLFENNDKSLKIMALDNNGRSVGNVIKLQPESKNKLQNSSSQFIWFAEENSSKKFIFGKGFKCGSETFSNDFYIFLELGLFIYLNEWYYLSIIVMFLTGVIIILYGGFALTTECLCKRS